MGRLTYTTQEVQDRLDAVDTLVRPNLLDNAYFIGGCSQQGGWQFPVNQRGSTSYSGTGNCIDRWGLHGSGASLSIGANSITASSTSNAHGFSQKIGTTLRDMIAGKTVTFSVLAGSKTGGAYISDTGNFASAHTDVSINANSITTYTFIVNENASSDCGVFLWLNSNSSVELFAAKLEIGDSQTLAHQENGEWSLNEVPKFQQELAKCQRYQIRIGYKSGETLMTTVGSGYAVSSTEVRILIPVPVTLRASPSIEYFNGEDVGHFLATGNGGAIPLTAARCVAYENMVMLIGTTSGLTTSNVYTLKLNSSYGVILNANL